MDTPLPTFSDDPLPTFSDERLVDAMLVAKSVGKVMPDSFGKVHWQMVSQDIKRSFNLNWEDRIKTHYQIPELTQRHIALQVAYNLGHAGVLTDKCRSLFEDPPWMPYNPVQDPPAIPSDEENQDVINEEIVVNDTNPAADGTNPAADESTREPQTDNPQTEETPAADKGKNPTTAENLNERVKGVTLTDDAGSKKRNCLPCSSG